MTASPAGFLRPERPNTPQWVKALVVAVVVLVLVVVVAMLAQGGEHGPDRHAAPSGQAAHPSGVPAATH